MLLAYLVLPRLHRILTTIYVPDYFIGRARTSDGLLGDPVNLASGGEAEQIHAAMAAAGWTQADEVTLGSSWRIVTSTLTPPQLPRGAGQPAVPLRAAAGLRLPAGGRRQSRRSATTCGSGGAPTAGCCPAAPGGLARRRHVRHRRSDLSLFTLQVTHRIDADTDIERDHIVDDGHRADPRVSVDVIEDFSTGYHARNGGGDSIRTDGDLPILDLTSLRAPEPAGEGPATDALSRAVSHRVPPPTLLAAAAISVGKAAVTLTAVFAAVVRGDSDPGAASTFEIAVMGISALCLVGLWAFMLAHHAWARFALMVVCTVEAVTQLLDLGAAADVQFSVLVSTATTVLILIAVSSTRPAAGSGSIDGPERVAAT